MKKISVGILQQSNVAIIALVKKKNVKNCKTALAHVEGSGISDEQAAGE